MREELIPARNVYLTRDDQGAVRGLSHRLRPVATGARTAQLASRQYLDGYRDLLEIAPAELVNLSVGPEPEPVDAQVEYRLAEEKPSDTLTTVGYLQTYFGLPVWGAGLAVHLGRGNRVLSSTLTGHRDIQVDKPNPRAVRRFRKVSTGELQEILKLAAGKEAKEVDLESLRVNRVRLVVYRYEEAEARPAPPHTPVRAKAEGAFAPAYPTLPVPPVADGIEEGRHYVAAEILFTLNTAPWGLLNWVVLVEINTASILYLRALVDNVDGMVFQSDPATQGSGAATSDNNATLNPLRTTVTLPGLGAPSGGTQSLSGTWIQVSDHEAPAVAPPTEAVGSDFNYSVRTNNFAAVNCYYHCDRFFRLVQSLGFDVATYFGGTTFPIQVDHRGRFGTLDGIEINASCGGNATSNGIGLPDFELLDLTDTTNPLGIACHWRVVLHEFGGHGILWNHVNSANFGFAHSAGDSFAAILNDPESAAPDRFATFPFTPISRRHDRSVASGWAWGGTSDTGGYNSEQILCTTNFRIYRSIGGDSGQAATRWFAANYMAYLMLRAVGTLTPGTNPGNASGFADALMTADLADWTSHGHAGGAYGKVIRWAFEKQGLYQPAGAPTPVTSAGAPPDVDVYIDDGRAGEYGYLANHWSCQKIWNRLDPDGGTTHQQPVVSVPNYAYVKIKNRGTQTATNVVVRGFHCQPASGLIWPTDWQAMTTAQLAAPDVAPNNAAEITVGPFEWTPSQLDHECMLMIVSATGDASNIDNFTAGDSIPEWRLVPHDNNIGQRNVAPVPGGGGLRGLLTAFNPRRFTVRNPHPHRARMELVVKLPALLAERGWKVRYANPGGSAFTLAPGQSREIAVHLASGGEFSREELLGTKDRIFTIETHADDILVGGMSYELDPDLKLAPPQLPAPEKRPGACTTQAKELLECLDLPVHRVKSVRVRKVTVEIEVADEDC